MTKISVKRLLDLCNAEEELEEVEALLHRELPKYELRRNNLLTPAEDLARLLPQPEKIYRISFLSGAVAVLLIWIMFEIGRKWAL